ncbi:LOW QUALITY PROTEIN: uncharacterized protein LOC125029867 [Penaeus chinensis]|uniref:LOW QUALITY PROTEIN: uncharacterized protein LOC125029867 n=1 Tax=Penaeus chinensis TaxID=139456 RepID=UPI001FB67022|nr:LOW QUALITY PROTEIN: uncharacterized protein LOC125029867 [Penaeus chinensis]
MSTQRGDLSALGNIRESTTTLKTTIPEPVTIRMTTIAPELVINKGHTTSETITIAQDTARDSVTSSKADTIPEPVTTTRTGTAPQSGTTPVIDRVGLTTLSEDVLNVTKMLDLQRYSELQINVEKSTTDVPGEQIPESEGDSDTIVENTERMVISVVKRDTLALSRRGRRRKRERLYTEMILHDSTASRRVRHRRHKNAQMATITDDQNEIPNDLVFSQLEKEMPDEGYHWQDFVAPSEETDHNIQTNLFMSPIEGSHPENSPKLSVPTDYVPLHLDNQQFLLTPEPSSEQPGKGPLTQYPLIKRQKPNFYSKLSVADRETYRRKMNFKGYEKKHETQTESSRSIIQSDVEDIPNELGFTESDSYFENDLNNYIGSPVTMSNVVPLTQIESPTFAPNSQVSRPVATISTTEALPDVHMTTVPSSTASVTIPVNVRPSTTLTATETTVATTETLTKSSTVVTSTNAPSTSSSDMDGVIAGPSYSENISTTSTTTVDILVDSDTPLKTTAPRSITTTPPSTFTMAPKGNETGNEYSEEDGSQTGTDETESEAETDQDEEKDTSFLVPAFIPAKLPFGPFIPNRKKTKNTRMKTKLWGVMPKNKVFSMHPDGKENGKKAGDFMINVLSPLFGLGNKKSRSKNRKILLEYDNERSHNEELYNSIGGSFMPTVDEEVERQTTAYPYIPFVRHQKHRMFTSSKLHGGFAFIDRMKGREDPPLVLRPQEGESATRSQNLVVLGHVGDDAIMETLRACTQYSIFNLTDHYNIAELTRDSSNPERQLIVYLNLKSINYEGYSIVLERAKRILDHLSFTHGGLTLFSVIPNDEDSINTTRSKEVKTFLLALNDDVLDYCARDYPSCYGTTNLEPILQNLERGYHKDTGFDIYDASGRTRGTCASNEVCGTESPTIVTNPSADLSTEQTLTDLGNAVCRSTDHIMLELIANMPTYDFDDYARAFENVKIESDRQKTPAMTKLTFFSLRHLKKRKKKKNKCLPRAASSPHIPLYRCRVRAQTGLVLHDILPRDLKQYDKNRPPKYEGHATIVYFHVTVLSVDSIDEESMTYVADIFLAQSWRDHRLRLPENMTEEYRILDVEWLHNIWRPDCFFKNAKKVTFHEMSVPNHYLWLYHDKTLLYMAKLTLVLSCAMKFEAYPHDTQICSMMIESLSHTTHDLVFKWNETDPLVVNPDIELPQLDISRNNTEDCTLTYSTGNFTCLAVVFNLRRRLGYHLFHTYVPSAITVVMSWISFWIKPEAIPARVTLGVTSLLTLATQNQQSQSSLPPVSYIKAIDVWMSSCTVFVFASLLQFGLVNYFMDAEPLTKDMTGYSVEDLTDLDDKKSEDGRANGYSRSRSRSRSRLRAHSPGVPQYVVHRCTGKDIAIYIDKFSRFFFPFAFFILNVSYWTTYGTM